MDRNEQRKNSADATASLTVDNIASDIETSDIEALIGRVQGPVFQPGDDGYDEERSGFQRALQQQPAVIVGASGAADVRAAVEFANIHRLPVAVQLTGHGLSRPIKGGVLISTRRMTKLAIDPEARLASLEAGVLWTQVIQQAASHGLAPLSGSAPNVGAVSYTLGGGLGLLSRLYGYAADHVRSIDVVTADGNQHHVTADSDPDLFWALRGGRDNFGVVTRLEVEVVPVTRLYGGGLFFATELVADVLDAYEKWTKTVPDEMTTSVALIPFPNVPVIPAPLRGRYVAHVRIAYTGDLASGERLVAPLRAVGPRLMDTLDDMPYTMSASIHNDPTAPVATYSSNATLREFDSPVARTVLEIVGPNSPLPCVVEVRHLGGALARVPSIRNAVGHRDAQYTLTAVSRLESADIGAVRAAHRHLQEALKPWAIGRCFNFMSGENTSTEQVRTAYDPGDYERLRDLKAVYDPTNMFRCNNNIPPAVER